MGNLTITTTNDTILSQQKEEVQRKKVEEEKSGVFDGFFDSNWSGKQIAKLTGDNIFTDWLQDKDKVCTDGEDDGKLSLMESAKSLGKGLIGGIPKTIINHPLATAVTVGLGAAAIALTGGAAAPLVFGLGAVGGALTAGNGIYQASKATTDAEAKMAYENIGTGVAFTAVSVKGVKSSKENIATKKAQQEEINRQNAEILKEENYSLYKKYAKECESLDAKRSEVILGELRETELEIGRLEHNMKWGFQAKIKNLSEEIAKKEHRVEIERLMGPDKGCESSVSNGDYSHGYVPAESEAHFKWRIAEMDKKIDPLRKELAKVREEQARSPEKMLELEKRKAEIESSIEKIGKELEETMKLRDDAMHKSW